ncbi:MAG: flagellar hook-length control protein FliK [Shewanella sp.]
MQQMNNIVPVKSVNNSPATDKPLSQQSNGEDFSAVLASVSPQSSLVEKAAVAQDTPKDIVTQAPKDDEQGGEEGNVNLIFSQIDMANQMSQAAGLGDSLPLEEGFISKLNEKSTDAADLLQGIVLSVSSTLPQEPEAILPIDTTKGANVSLVSAIDMSAVNHVDINGVDTNLSPVEDASLETPLSQVNPPVASPNSTASVINPSLSATASLSATTANLNTLGTSELVTLPQEPEAIFPIDSTKGANVSLVSAIDKSAVNHVDINGVDTNLSPVEDASLETPLSQVNPPVASPNSTASVINSSLSATASLSATTANLNTLGTSELVTHAGNSELKLDDAQINIKSAVPVTAQQLKEAMLAVTLDSDQERGLSAVSDDQAPLAEFKSLSATAASTAQLNIHRQDVLQVQLSLRQGVEQQNQMQEMIQRFSPVMKQQLITMVSQGIQHAEIRLDPPELGHMLVKIQVHGDQTQVQFHVTQAQTRDLVEQAIPRLRELLQEQGMQLADSHVSQGNQGDRREGWGDSGGSSSNGADLDDIAAEELHLGLNQATGVTSGIDYYA